MLIIAHNKLSVMVRLSANTTIAVSCAWNAWIRSQCIANLLQPWPLSLPVTPQDQQRWRRRSYLWFLRRGKRERWTPWKKLRARVIHIWNNRRSQPHRSAMVSLILEDAPSGSRKSSTPGKCRDTVGRNHPTQPHILPSYDPSLYIYFYAQDIAKCGWKLMQLIAITVFHIFVHLKGEISVSLCR